MSSVTAGVRLPDEVLPPSTRVEDLSNNSELAVELYRQMMLIRAVEDVVQPLYNSGEIHGTTHLYSGEEAIAVGICSLLGTEDRVAATYRGHGHLIAIGSSAQGLLDELLGRATGAGGGRAGSMNVIDMEHGLLGCFGIVGGSIAAATGAALALRGTGAIAVAFFGDGTVNQGYFHECLNFAKVHDLPILFVCENNLFGEFTPVEQVTPGGVAARPEALEIPVARINGNDLWEVRGQARATIDAIRAESRPGFIEALTYRFGGHSRSDPGAYRPAGELDAWKERDPLVRERARLVGEVGLARQAVEKIDAEVLQEVEEMVEKGLAAPSPVTDPSLTEFAP